jgi:uncharacterized protein (DUF1330 family)
MPAYLIAIVNVTNPDAYAEYAKLAGTANQKYGSRFLARGGKTEVLEGSFPGSRIVVAEFESMERARQFYHSSEYQAARHKRLGAADFNMVLIEGQ